MPSICHLEVRGTRRFKDSALGRVRPAREKVRPKVASHTAWEEGRLFHLHGAVRMGGVSLYISYDTCDPLPLTGLSAVSLFLEI